MLNISSVDRGTVVTRFVGFSWTDNDYGNNVWNWGIERKVFVEEKKGNYNWFECLMKFWKFSRKSYLIREL